MAGFLPSHPLLWRSHLFFFLPWQSIADSYSTSLFPLSFFPLPSVSSSDEPPTTETRPRVYSEPPLIHFEPPRIDSGPLLVEAPIHFQRFWLATPGPSQRPVNDWCCGARNPPNPKKALGVHIGGLPPPPPPLPSPLPFPTEAPEAPSQRQADRRHQRNEPFTGLQE